MMQLLKYVPSKSSGRTLLFSLMTEKECLTIFYTW